MIRIRQHGEENSLFDIKQFLQDIDVYFEVSSWFVEIGWCQGKNSERIEKETAKGKEYTNNEFRKLYSGIFQTIEGSFHLVRNNEIVAKFLAVDSSYWEVEATSAKFEKHMLNKYGAYSPQT